MEVFVLMLSMFLAAGSSLALVAWVVGFTVHWQMTKENREVLKWDYASFKQFQAEVSKHKLTPMQGYKGSFSGPGVYIHAGIIRFGNKGMCLTPIAYLQFLKWQRKNYPKPTGPRQKGLWSAK